MPLNYAADELNFLQKMGGSYVFIHRYLLDHFTAMADASQAARRSASMARVGKEGVL